MHLGLPELPEKVPAGHLVQEADLICAKDVVPGGQRSQVAVPPSENWPAVHARQRGTFWFLTIVTEYPIPGAQASVLSASKSKSSEYSDEVSSRSRSAATGESKASSSSRSASTASPNSGSLNGIAAAAAIEKASSAMLKINFIGTCRQVHFFNILRLK